MLLKRREQIFILLGLAVLWYGQPAFPRDILVDIHDIEEEETKSAGFVLNEEQNIDIEAVGSHRRSKSPISTSAWILNADTRDLVWELTDANSRWVSRKLREYHDGVTLPKGTYEVYYSNFPYHRHDHGWSWSQFFFGDADEEDYQDIYHEFKIVVRGTGTALGAAEVENYRSRIKEKALVSLNVNRDDCYEYQGFELKKPLELIIYAIGEATDDGAFDYGWIINTETREQVWRFTYHDSEFAGGSEKNRMFKETVSLPAGRYAAFFVSDDSHSPSNWNAPPPYDANFWGLSVFAKNDSQPSEVALFDYEDIPPKNVIVQFISLGDDEFVFKGFTLKKDLKVRIYALGEGRDGEMVDYGWIIDAKTRQRLWEMNFYDTRHAGGDIKNRLYDGITELKKGSYLVYFVTDGSHSASDWNASPPFDPDHWGITLIAAEEDFNPADIAEYTEEEPKVLARIVRVGDRELKKERFSLKKQGEIRIYALGEGRNGRMYDYAWIEDAATGKAVWEMTYRKTNHAGGASKNRMFDDTIFLKAGDYLVYYESDDSHSFNDWNDTPPRDRVNWGVTIYSLSE